MKPIDKHLQKLLHITGQSHVITSAISSTTGKAQLLRSLYAEVPELNLDEVSRVKVKLWLDKHLKIIEAE